MSKIALSGNASGTGTLTIAAPNTSTDRTLTLPDQTGTLLTGSGAIGVNSSAATNSLVIDASGNVGVGTSSPAYKLTVAGSGDVYGQIATSNGGAYLNLDVQTATPDYKAIWGTVAGVRKWGIGNFGTSASDVIAFYTGGATERARIDSSGNLLVGTTSTDPIGANTTGVVLRPYAAASFAVAGDEAIKVMRKTSTGGLVTFFYNGANVVGTISTNGTSTSYNTSSDYRLKEAIAPMTGALAKVAALKPCTYTWKNTGEADEGFIAHELQEVCPSAVTGEKDAVDAEGNPQYQGIDTSFLVATLTAAIQELKAIVDAQGAEIAALKGTA